MRCPTWGGGEAYRELQENILSQISQWAHMHCQLRSPSRFWCRAGFGNPVVVGFVNVGLAATAVSRSSAATSSI